MDKDDKVDELEGRLDGLRIVVALLIRSLPDPAQVLVGLMEAEHLCRKQNLRTGSIEEIMALREMLDDL